MASADPAYPTAEAFLPKRLTLPALQRAARKCEGCPLYKNATQTVFGEGPADASLVLVGEQPGDQEDRAGHPFVGPSGQLLDRALEEAGIDRGGVYVTNAVKHFKFEQRGKRRIHSKPGAREVQACKPWLGAELEVLQPRILVSLGATAAQSLLGKAFRLTRARGELLRDTAWQPVVVLATYHPSALLRMPDAESRHRAYEAFVADFATVARFLETRHG